MTAEMKSQIMGAAASGAPTGKRLEKDVGDKGQPFSFHEMKPLALWQTILEHTGVTHVVDLSPGSGALALAAAWGSIHYEGIAANPTHKEWLDIVIDKIVLYLCGKPDDTGPEMIKKLGGDEEFAELFAKRCSGNLAEAKRYCEPEASDGEGGTDGESSESAA